MPGERERARANAGLRPPGPALISAVTGRAWSRVAPVGRVGTRQSRRRGCTDRRSADGRRSSRGATSSRAAIRSCHAPQAVMMMMVMMAARRVASRWRPNADHLRNPHADTGAARGEGSPGISRTGRRDRWLIQSGRASSPRASVRRLSWSCSPSCSPRLCSAARAIRRCSGGSRAREEAQ